MIAIPFALHTMRPRLRFKSRVDTAVIAKDAFDQPLVIFYSCEVFVKSLLARVYAKLVEKYLSMSNKINDLKPENIEKELQVENIEIKPDSVLVNIFSYKIGGLSALDPKTFPHGPEKAGDRPRGTLENVAHMLNAYGVIVRYNVIKKKSEIFIPYLKGDTDNGNNSALTHIISLAALNSLPLQNIANYIEALADLNQYNPVKEWILSKPWDGTDRMNLVYDTITEKADYPSVLKRILMRKWLLSAVAAVLKDTGFHTRGMLTFQGAQGLGKTSWVRSLVSDPVLREKVVKVDHHLDASNKDSILGAVSHWVVEVGELDSSLKRDVARLKGFVTSDHDKIRRPYAREDSEYSRRTVFCATVNDPYFLVDTTGNSRFWTISVESINYNHGIDMQQVFAQMAVDFENGEEWWLTSEEEQLLDETNGAHRAVSVIREEIMEVIDTKPGADVNMRNFTASALLKELGHENPTNPQARECGAILRELFGDPNTKGSWKIPFRKDTNDFLNVDFTAVDLAEDPDF